MLFKIIYQGVFIMKKKYLLIMLIALFAASASAQDGMKKVLLAMEKTKFKKELIAEMTDRLEKKSFEVTVVDNHKKELKNYRASDFDYVFITNSGVNSKVRPWVVEWLHANRNSKNILLHTTKIKKWKEQVDVDSVSSASKPSLASSLAEKYIDLLLKK